MTLIFANLTWKEEKNIVSRDDASYKSAESLCEKKGIKRPPSLMRSFWDNERLGYSSIFMMTMLRDLTNSHDSLNTASDIFVFVGPILFFLSLIQLLFCVLKSFFF